MHNFQEQLSTWAGDALEERREVVNSVAAQGYPTRRDEAWKYTDLSSALSPEYQLISTSDAVVDVSAYCLPECDRLVMINGVFDAAQSVLPEVIDVSWETTAQFDFPKDATVFERLNAAFQQRRLILTIPENVQLAKPLQLLSVMTEQVMPSMLHTQCMIRLSPQARAIVLDDSVSLGAQLAWRNVVTTLQLDTHANLTYYKVQRDSKATTHLSNTRVRLAQSAELKHHHFALGAALNHETLEIELNEPFARCELLGLFDVKKDQHVAHHIEVSHRAKNCETHQLYKGLARDNGQGVFDAKIKVQPEGAGAIAHQSNKNLLLSPEAEIDTKPGLEIYTDDVQCSHGATIGQLDETALFYLQSRGIPKAHAEQLLTMGFISALLEKLSNDPVAQTIRDVILGGEGNA